VTIQSTPELRPLSEEVIAVALVSPSEFLQLKKGSTTSKELEAKAKDTPKPDSSVLEADKPNPILGKELPSAPPPSPQEVANVEPPPAAEPPKADPIADKLAEPPPPTPGPTTEQVKAEQEAKAKAEAEKKAQEDKKKAEEKKKAEDKKKADDKKKAEMKKLADAKKKAEEEKKKQADPADRLSALLNKDPTKKGAQSSATEPKKPTDYTGPTAGADRGDAPEFSAREKDLLAARLRNQLSGCWTLPGGGGGSETPIVTVRWNLTPDGMLQGQPEIINQGTGAYAGLAVEAAIRAINKCQPFDLPKDSYGAWKVVEWDFDPTSMR
jgi:colicin import membrane protein